MTDPGNAVAPGEARRLLVMRHAKAHPFGPTDQERELTPRGRLDAAEAGRWTRDSGLLPTHALVSTAARTRATWEEFRAAAGLTFEATFDDSLYSAGPDAAMEVLRSVGDDVPAVILVGHNPTVSHLVHLLDDGTADPQVFDQVAAGYPTCALTVLELTGSWRDLGVAGARIIQFHVGRD